MLDGSGRVSGAASAIEKRLGNPHEAAKFFKVTSGGIQPNAMVMPWIATAAIVRPDS
jgi:hypothetical protein